MTFQALHLYDQSTPDGLAIALARSPEVDSTKPLRIEWMPRSSGNGKCWLRWTARDGSTHAVEGSTQQKALEAALAAVAGVSVPVGCGERRSFDEVAR